ncbi:Uncharacterised protein [Vibrio cholerae]|nr:Uncharacterised protein [Vibrio cholerae]CSI05608.1 Uncharacterised protein [Vibrio cholerae]
MGKLVLASCGCCAAKVCSSFLRDKGLLMHFTG